MSKEKDKSEAFKSAASNLGIDPEEEDLFISPKYVPDAQWDPERWNGMSEKEAMEKYTKEDKNKLNDLIETFSTK